MRLDLITALDLFGTFVFAVSGAFRAIKHELDLFGVLVLAVATGVGGGVVRDMMLGVTPPAAFRHEAYLVICVAGGLIAFLAPQRIARRWDSVVAADAVGLGVFAALGAAAAARGGMGSLGIVLMAAVTAAGGGVIRDVLVTEVPMVLRADVYASAALAGGVAFVLARRWGATPQVQLAAAALVTLALRATAIRFRLALPRARRLPVSPAQLTRMRKTGRGEGDAGSSERNG